MSLQNISQDELLEMSFIEIAYELLKERKTAVTFEEMIKIAAKILKLSQEEVEQKVAQFYTDLNTDGRFTFRGDGWGLRSWYQIEHIDDAPITDIRMKKKKAKKATDEDFEGFDIEDEEDEFEEELEELEDLDEEIEDVETVGLIVEDIEEDVEDFDLDIEETEELDVLDEELDEDLDDEEDASLEEDEEDKLL